MKRLRIHSKNGNDSHKNNNNNDNICNNGNASHGSRINEKHYKLFIYFLVTELNQQVTLNH